MNFDCTHMTRKSWCDATAKRRNLRTVTSDKLGGEPFEMLVKFYLELHGGARITSRLSSSPQSTEKRPQLLENRQDRDC